MFAHSFHNDAVGFLEAHLFLIYTLADQRIIHIGYGHDPGFQRDVFPL